MFSFNLIWLLWDILDSTSGRRSIDLGAAFRDTFQKDLSYFLTLCRSLPKGKYHVDRGVYIHEGQFLGKEIKIEYRCGPRNRTRRELQISIPVIQKFWLRLLEQGHESDHHEEITINDEVFDSRFIIHSDQPQIAIEFLTRPFIRNELPQFSQIKRLEFYRGRLKVILSGRLEVEMKPADFGRIMNFLARLADDYELQASLLKMLPIRTTDSFCPYCREKFMRKTGIKQCSRCGATLHQDCWNENGQCTTWGCN